MTTPGRYRALLLGGVMTLLAIAAATVILLGHRSTDSAAPQPTPVASPVVQVPGLPGGATACPQVYDDPQAPFQRGARGTPMTSCPFVEQVRLAYAKRSPATGPLQIRVASPATGKWYDLVCMPTGNHVTCSGGVIAVVYLYNG